jgi:hypothetical protein
MSLIVDINPVPWEILELVKARILKNRSKRQPQEQLGELKRAMSLRPGPLSRKRREEEPSFVSSEETPYIVVVTGGQYGHKYLSDVSTVVWFDYRNVPPTTAIDTVGYTYSDIGNVTVKFNGITVKELENPGVDNFIAYLFVWVENINTQKDIQANFDLRYANTYENQESTYYAVPNSEIFGTTGIPAGQTPTGRKTSPNPNVPYLVKLSWKIVFIDSSKIAEPGRGDNINLELVPNEPINFKFSYQQNLPNLTIYSGYIDDSKINSIKGSTLLSNTQSYAVKFLDLNP